MTITIDIEAWWKSALHKSRIQRAKLLRGTMRGTTFIGVTGSSGKSTTTALLSHILDRVSPTETKIQRSTPEGVALRVLRAGAEKRRFLVQEVSASIPGYISQSTAILRPDVVVVTVIGMEHRKTLRTLEGIAAEKSELVAGVEPHGVALLNADDPLVVAMAEKTQAEVAYYGRANRADLRLLDVTYRWGEPLHLKLSYQGSILQIESRLIGRHWAVAIMAALLAALKLGVDVSTCRQAIADFQPVFNRLSVHPRRGGGWYILDAAKAPVWSIDVVLDLMRTIKAPRTTIVIGTLSDTKGTSRVTYTRTARAALEVADRVIFTGPSAARIRTEIDRQSDDRLRRIDDHEALRRHIAEDVVPGEVILVKGSLHNHLERLMLQDAGPVVCKLETCRLECDCNRCSKLVGASRRGVTEQQRRWIDEAAASHIPTHSA